MVLINLKGDFFMKKNFVIALVLTILCFILLGGAIFLEIKEQEQYCMYAGMAATLVAFFAVLFGINSWKEK